MARDWPYIKQCFEEIQQLIKEAKKIDINNKYDVYYYEFMLQMALEDLEYEIKK